MARIEVLTRDDCGPIGFVVCDYCGEPLLPGDAIYRGKLCHFCSAGCDCDHNLARDLARMGLEGRPA